MTFLRWKKVRLSSSHTFTLLLICGGGGECFIDLPLIIGFTVLIPFF